MLNKATAAAAEAAPPAAEAVPATMYSTAPKYNMKSAILMEDCCVFYKKQPLAALLAICVDDNAAFTR